MKRDYRLDVIRAVAILMIFTFHFCSAIGNKGVFYGYANGGWGSVGTTMFFILSGFLLGTKYHANISIKNFYWKRWLSIFPLFYLTFAVAFIVNGLTTGNWKYGGEWWRMVFTLFGCDNFLGFYGISSYALVGEWFTAVIVIIYLAYPLLNIFYQRYKSLGSVLIYGLYFINLGVEWFQIVDDANPITGIAMFWTGMLAAGYTDKIKNRLFLIPEAGLAVLVIFVKLPGNPLLWKNMLACMIFGMLFIGGEYVEKVPFAAKAFLFISKYSYGIYLCHHFIIIRGLALAPDYMGRFGTAAEYAVLLIVTAAVSVALYQLLERIKALARRAGESVLLCGK
ncbi:MAG: acyltransferase [Lachnospiraceae bacterium]|nr:acyltransferase [Lachnospiraceae bacterium]